MTRTHSQPLLLFQSLRTPDKGTPEGVPLPQVSVSLWPSTTTASTHTLLLAALLESNNSIALWRLCLHLLLGNPEIPGQERPDPGHPSFLSLKAGVTSIGRYYSNKRLSLSPRTAKRDRA